MTVVGTWAVTLVVIGAVVLGIAKWHGQIADFVDDTVHPVGLTLVEPVSATGAGTPLNYANEPVTTSVKVDVTGLRSNRGGTEVDLTISNRGAVDAYVDVHKLGISVPNSRTLTVADTLKYSPSGISINAGETSSHTVSFSGKIPVDLRKCTIHVTLNLLLGGSVTVTVDNVALRPDK